MAEIASTPPHKRPVPAGDGATKAAGATVGGRQRPSRWESVAPMRNWKTDQQAERQDGAPDDEALLWRTERGDEEAFKTLFTRYARRVHYFAERRLQDSYLADEVVTDVFFEIWRNASSFRGNSRVSTWIFGIAQFKCSSASRDRRRMKRAALLPTQDDVLQSHPDTFDLAEHIDSRSELRRLIKTFRKLPLEQQRAAQMALLEGLSYEEISSRLQVPMGTIKTRVSRARSRLRRYGHPIAPPRSTL